MCSLCKYTEYLVCTLFLFFVGGYVGKGLYLESVDDAFLGISHGTFWIPDGTFWLFACLTTVAGWGVVLVLGLFVETFFGLIKRIFLTVIRFTLGCICPCWWCPWNEWGIEEPHPSIRETVSTLRKAKRNGKSEMEMSLLQTV